MKKLFSLLLLVLLVTGVGSAQMIKEGQMNINAGIGIGMAGIYGDMKMPAISASLDYGINDKMSIGGLVGYSSSEQKVYGDYGWKYSYLVIGARGAYHFELGKNFDPYVGVILGYNVVSASTIGTAQNSYWGTTYSASASYMMFGGFLGGRYYVSDNFAIFGEVGYGLGLLTAGVSIKI